jgi:iron complex transport system substrate-binding protein
MADLKLEEAARQVVDAAYHMHKRLGPGLLESTYGSILQYDLERRGLTAERQIYIDLKYDDLFIPHAYCIDFIINECLVVELKATEKLAGVHFRQLLTYLKLTDHKLGLLINFGQLTLKDGIHRLANNY